MIKIELSLQTNLNMFTVAVINSQLMQHVNGAQTWFFAVVFAFVLF